MIQHGYIQYPKLVGISREASPHADTITYYSYDGTGEMIDVANRATDIPFVEVSTEQHNVDIQWKALAYDWSDREIGKAMLTGINLEQRKVRTAFRIAEEEKERVFLNGNAAYGWDGMINNTTIPTATATNEWSTATALQIQSDINELLVGSWDATNQVRIADTLLLPVDQFGRLQNPMGDDANRSIMSYIKENNIYTSTTGNELMVMTVRQLQDAGAGTTDRAIAYPRDMDVLRYHIPQELQFIEPQRVGMSWIYYGNMVLGGLEIMEPTAMRYLDGI